METNNEISEVLFVFRQWEEEHTTQNYDPVPVLTRLAELIEAQAENYMKMDPDPFDERHPSRADPSCALGQMLKILFRKDNFMNKLVNDYVRDNYWSRLNVTNKDVRELNIAACRLMLDIMPGLETSAVFETPTSDALGHRLYNWAEKSPEPLQTYATGLLAAAMEVQDVAAGFREENSKLVPLMLERLHSLQSQAVEERHQGGVTFHQYRPFAQFGRLKRDLDPDPNILNHTKERLKDNEKNSSLNNDISSPVEKSKENDKDDISEGELQNHVAQLHPSGTPPRANGVVRRLSDSDMSNENKRKKARIEMTSPPHNSFLMSPPPRPSPFNVSDCSNSSWAEMESYVIGHIQMYPPTLATKQIFILKYLTPMGEYQEFLSHVFEKNALDLILQFINLRESKNSRLAFEALKYLASLLCHKKFSIEFINMQGLQRLLEVPRPSIAATGVSICLYYLAYCEDAMERVCLLPQHILSDLVRYSLWLLECSHDSGRCHATMFFGLSFQFRIIREEFDAQDGLRKLYNVMSTLPILAVEEEATLNEDEECSARQIVRHVCVALKRYLEAHLHLKAEQLRRAHLRENGSETQKYDSSLPSYKAYKSSPEEIEGQINTLLELMSFKASWQPVDELMRLGGITLLLQVIAFAYEWNFSGRMHRAETVRSALDVLCICAVMPRVQLHLCERVDLPDETMTVGMNVILGAAEGEIVADPDVQRAALGVLITCVCAPINREAPGHSRGLFQTPWPVGSQTSKKPNVGGSVARYSTNGSAKKRTHSLKSSKEIIEKLWDCVRSNNGIMVLLTLMMVKTPITDADSIRALACQALCGLARSETVRQIISKLPLFTNGQLQNLMRDPILQDKRQEHVKFQKYAIELLERVYGKSKTSGMELEVSLAKIHRANIIAQSRIQFSDRQLFQLMHNHLLQHGMVESAMVLQREAGLPPPSVIKPGVSSTFLSPFTYQQRSPGQPSSRARTSQGHHIHRMGPLTNMNSDLASPSCSPLGAGFSVRGNASASSNTPPTGQPIKLTLTNNRRTELKFPSNGTPSRSLQKQLSYEPTQVSASQPMQNYPSMFKECHVTLDSIITEHLTNQHALCKNPMVTCPQFNLFEPHKCPDPRAKNSSPLNFTMRLGKGIQSRRLDQRLVHSRFFPLKTFRLGEKDEFFTCCVFFGNDKNLVIGTHQGEVKMFNLLSGAEEGTWQCHESYISNLQAGSDGLLLTSSTWRRPLSALWKHNDLVELKFAMEEDEYVEFSKLTQDRIIGTKGEVATIYDVNTGKSLMTLSPTQSNQYNKNRATFNPTDELVLSDGVLWDVNSGKEIHKLDKLNQVLSGVFHPNGLEIISNTEVWDIRTFHLLRTVSSLEQCDILFNSTGSTVYAVSLEQENEDDNSYETSFKTLDAYDYTSIATIDVKKNIYDLACNRLDTQIAIVENQGMFESVQESSVRLYDVGRRRDDEDEADDEEEEDEDLDNSEDGSSPDSHSDDDDANSAGDGEENQAGDLGDVIAEVAAEVDDGGDDNDNNEELLISFSDGTDDDDDEDDDDNDGGGEDEDENIILNGDNDEDDDEDDPDYF